MSSTTCRRIARTAKTATNARCAYVLRTRKPSRGSKDILRIREDSGTNERRESLGRHEFDRTSEARFQQIGEREKPVKRLRAWCELNEKVHVALRARLPAQDRSKQREPDHAEAANLLPAFAGEACLPDPPRPGIRFG
jgi:hypothetical protein